jgi:serine/threonine protein kinase
VSPEILNGRPFSNKSDVFSLGIVFYNLVSGQKLFAAAKRIDLLNQNKYLKPKEIIMKEVLPISKIGLDLLLQMLEVRADVRPSAKECLEHEWFKEDHTTLQFMIKGSRVNKAE